jgi:Zn-dependent protease
MPDRGSFRIARIAGVDLRLHYSWLIIAALITFSLGNHFRALHMDWSTPTIWLSALITGLLFFVGLIAHEMSHAMVARSRGLPIRKITLFLLGGVAQIEREAPTAGTEFWMAIAGPAMSVLFGFVCLGLALTAGWRWGQMPQVPLTSVLVWLGYINLMLAAFNLIPGFPMDGGRILRAFIWWVTGNAQKATLVAVRIGQAFGWLFIAWGLWQLFSGRGFGSLWIALIGWFLLQSSSATLANSLAQSGLKGLTTGQLMSKDCVTIGQNLDLQSFVDSYLLGTGNRCYIVVDGNRLLGIITPNEVRVVDRRKWPDTTVAQAMLPFSQLHTISPETPALDALNTMASEDVNQLPVVDHGKFIGVLNRSNVLGVLQNRIHLRAA